MIRDRYEAMKLLVQPGAFAHPKKGGQSHYVKALRKNRYKECGTVSDATIRALTDEGFLVWHKQGGLLNINATEAGRTWFKEEFSRKHGLEPKPE